MLNLNAVGLTTPEFSGLLSFITKMSHLTHLDIDDLE